MADSTEQLYVANMRGGDISVIDLASHEVVEVITMDRVEVDGEDWAMQVDSLWASPDGTRMYASRYPGPVGRSRGEARRPGDLIVIDTATRQVLWNVEVGGQANHVTGSPDGRHVYVPVRDRHWIAVVDTGSREVVDRVNCGWGPHGTEISADGRHLYVGTIWNHTLTVIDTAERRSVTRIPLGESVRPFQIDAEQRTAYAQLSRLHGFVVVDLERERVSQTVHLPDLDPGIELEKKPGYTVDHGMRLAQDGTLLVAAASVADYLAVYSVPDLRLVRTVTTGREPAYVGLTGDGTRAFTCNRGEDTVSIWSLPDFEEIARVPVGTYPNRMASVTA